ncbi:hypothetical protein [Mumia zhuanghuii]|uniref:hypothetical protein n=1 Tax=Mumia zhuanghuii TaxID=2585211 RepID=UPI00363DF632
MVEVPRPAASAAVGLGRSLLEAKFSIPQPRPGSVSRAGIIDVARASECRVVGVTAAAGLDGYDDDPTVLLTLLASAFAQISPGSIDLVADMGSLGAEVLGRAAPRLAAAFTSSPEPFVLMVDDLHELRASACHDALGVAISGIPSGSQLVAASRFEQPHLPRFRASGDVFELDGSDLALDAAGAEQIFAEADAAVAPEVAAAITERTEGWHYRESSMLLPKKMQRFLRRTSATSHPSPRLPGSSS